jgi:hypothetical protein
MKRFILAGSLALAGCHHHGTETEVEKVELAKNGRPIVPWEQVKIYDKGPSVPYDVIDVVSADGVNWISFKGEMEKAVRNLRQEAGRLGANGIIPISAGDANSGAVKYKTATAYAIFVQATPATSAQLGTQAP